MREFGLIKLDSIERLLISEVIKMGFGSMFGSLGRAIRRPFKDIHKAVKGSGRFMNKGFGQMHRGVGKIGRGITGRSKSDNMASRKGSLLKDFAGKMESPQKVRGSQGKKPGEWRGSTFIGSGTKPEDIAQQKKKKKPIMGSTMSKTSPNIRSGYESKTQRID